jgi:hypothetical protein
MKKLFIYLVAIVFLFSSCSKDEDAFQQTPDERINESLSKYQSALTSSPAGWNATISTGTGGVFHFYFRFSESNRVIQYCDFNETTARVAKESSYRLKSLQQPVLMFDTYSYIHLLADPTGTVNGGNNGEGLISDFEFSLDTLYSDSILLTGRFNGTKLKLEKASQEDLDAWQNGVWANSLSFLNLSKIIEYFKRFSYGGVTYEIYLDPTSRTITFQWISGGTLKRFTTSYYFDKTGLILDDPLVNGSQTISSFTNIVWNDPQKTMSIQINGSNSTISGATQPIKPDLNGARRWWQTVASQDGYWVTLKGFHVNGVDDAYNLLSIPDFAFLLFWPAYGPIGGGTNYDLLGFVTQTTSGLALNFGAGYDPPQFTADGRVLFTLIGTLGNIPPEAEPAFTNTAEKFNEAAGFYLVQTSENSYDMVSAADARSWITWIL